MLDPWITQEIVPNNAPMEFCGDDVTQILWVQLFLKFCEPEEICKIAESSRE